MINSESISNSLFCFAVALEWSIAAHKAALHLLQDLDRVALQLVVDLEQNKE